jgi:mono/diheme cytochrome c family protein
MTITLSIFILLFNGFFWMENSNENLTKLDQEKDKLAKSVQAGKEIYQDFCVRCHLADGKGSKTVPPLVKSDWLIQKRKESIHAVKFGQSGEIVVNGNTYKNSMPPMGLTNDEVADVMNYIMNSWSNKQTKIVTVAEVATIKK